MNAEPKRSRTDDRREAGSAVPQEFQPRKPKSLTVGLLLVSLAIGIEFVRIAISVIVPDWAGFEGQGLSAGRTSSDSRGTSAWGGQFAPRLFAFTGFVAIPTMAALCAARSERWPRIVLSSFAALLLVSMFELGFVAVMQAIFATSAIILLWLTPSRLYARGRKEQRSPGMRQIGSRVFKTPLQGSGERRSADGEPKFRTLLGRQKSTRTAYLLLLVLGVVGAHKVYLRHSWIGIIYATVFVIGMVDFRSIWPFTGLAIALAIDACRIPQKVHEINRTIVGG